MTTQEMPVKTVGDWNGHFRHKGIGKTDYNGKLESLPMPSRMPTVSEAVQAMYDDGYVIFPGLLSRAKVAELHRFDGMGGPDEKYTFPNWCFNKQLALDVTNDPHLLELIDQPGAIEVVDAIHRVPFTGANGGPKQNAIVTGGSIWITGQGRKMGIHLDTQLVEVPESVLHDPSVRIPIFKSTLHFYLNDMRADLGPTTLIPGSHKSGRYPVDESTWNGIAPQAVMVNAGDAMLFRSDIWHGAALNSSEERRYMVQVFYGCDFLAPNFPPMRYDKYWSPGVLAKATPRQRRLLGASGPSTDAY